jgi:hypothetical protein
MQVNNPDFANEAEEAEWWDSNEDVVLAVLEAAQENRSHDGKETEEESFRQER